MAGQERASKTIVITGVTSGLGLAMKNYFEKQSYIVIGCGRNESKISSLNREEKSNRFFVVDVSKDTEVAAWARQVNDQFGPPDILINNAGIINHNANLWEVAAE